MTQVRVVSTKLGEHSAHRLDLIAKSLGVTTSEAARRAIDQLIVQTEEGLVGADEAAPTATLMVPIIERLQKQTGTIIQALQAQERVLENFKRSLLGSERDAESMVVKSEEILERLVVAVAVELPVVLCNTNVANDPAYHHDMLREQIAKACYGEAVARFRNNVRTGSRVILYQSGMGAIASGIAATNPIDRMLEGDQPGAPNEAYVQLLEFRRFQPIPARRMKQTMSYAVHLMKTVIPLPEDAGEALWAHILQAH